ncbi:MAG: extracellular solute-binding protein [Spirochaetaceae bacterium]|jgi:raffinose/stachyose/melibiose transport system substrate-binding protein|nr:extracellular solute-binding protein [Spirochaetaceae bacterium]
MKKLMIGLLTAVCVLAVSCSKENKNGEAVTLSVYMQMDLAHPMSEYWPVTLEAFAQKYPDIKLEFDYISGEPFHDKFQAMAASGDIPDLFTCYAGTRSSYLLSRGLVKDLRPYLDDQFKSNFNGAIWEPQGPNGEIYIVSPNIAVCTEIFVNTKLQKQLGLDMPLTLDEMIAQAPEIRKAGLTPLMFANKASWQATSLLLSTLVDRTAGRAWFDAAISGAAAFSDAPFVDALSIIKRMVDTQLFPQGVNQLEDPESWGAFVQGKAVYLLEAGWRIAALKNAAAPEDYEQYQVIPFPAVNGEVNKGSSAGTLGEALAMNAHLSKEKADAAWKFISFIYGEEGADILMKYGSLPTYKLDYSRYDIDALNRQYIELTGVQPLGYVIDGKMDGEGVHNILDSGLQAVMMGTKTPEELASEYEAWVAANDPVRKK